MYVLVAFTYKNNRSHSKFTTQTIQGNSITIEYYEPNKVHFEGELKIYRIAHIFKDIFHTNKGYSGGSGFNQSLSCNVDVSYSDHEQQAKAVCRICFFDKDSNFASFCSGALINNEFGDNNSRYPLLMTAAHCLGNESAGEFNYVETVFDFNYQGPAVVDPKPQSVVGATLLSKGTESDYALFGLSIIPENSYDVSYLGWNRSLVYTPATESIHHPKGDIKKVAKGLKSPTLVTMKTTDEYGQNWELVDATPNPSNATHWQVYWNQGVTEPGSSGAPLIAFNGRMIGQLSNGPQDVNCDNTAEKDFNFGSLNYSWTHPDPGWKSLVTYFGNESYMFGYYPNEESGSGSKSGLPICISKEGGYSLKPTVVLGDFNLSS